MSPRDISEKYFEEANLTSREELLQHVSFSAMRNLKASLPGLETWSEAAIKKEPTEIYDINGKLLFLDYPVVKGGEIQGHIRAAASKVLGSPVIAHEIGSRTWNFEQAVKKLTPQVKKDHPTMKILGAKLVCYSYPKLGVMFEGKDDRGKSSSFIFDVADLSVIPLKSGKTDKEGAFAWSFYDSLSEQDRKDRLKRYNQEEDLRQGVPDRLRKELLAVKGPLLTLKKLGYPSSLLIKKTIVKQLQFCNHYRYDEIRSHHCFVLHGQQKSNYCAVATCQMILCYYRYYYTQDEIAPKLGYTSTGGCPPDQSSGYETLTCKHLDATYDTSPTWEKARDQIDALHPFKTGIKGHARACAGYSCISWILLRLGITDKKLYIYDPWPWNADYKLGGTLTWEDWDSITHTNFVFTRIACP